MSTRIGGRAPSKPLPPPPPLELKPEHKAQLEKSKEAQQTKQTGPPTDAPPPVPKRHAPPPKTDSFGESKQIPISKSNLPDAPTTTEKAPRKALAKHLLNNLSPQGQAIVDKQDKFLAEQFSKKNFGVGMDEAKATLEKQEQFLAKKEANQFSQKHFGIGTDQANAVLGKADKFQNRRGQMNQLVTDAKSQVNQTQALIDGLKDGSIQTESPDASRKLLKSAQGHLRKAGRNLKRAEEAVGKFNSDSNMSDKKFSKLSKGVQKHLDTELKSGTKLDGKVRHFDQTKRASGFDSAISTAKENVGRAGGYIDQIRNDISSGKLPAQEGQELLKEAEGYQKFSQDKLKNLENTQKQFQLTGKLDKSDLALPDEQIKPKNAEQMLDKLKQMHPDLTALNRDLKSQVDTMDRQLFQMNKDGVKGPEVDQLKATLKETHGQFAKTEALLRSVNNGIRNLDQPGTFDVGDPVTMSTNQFTGQIPKTHIDNLEAFTQFPKLALRTGFN